MRVTSSELKQHINLLSQSKNEDIIITKHDKPFAVIIDYNKYQKLIQKIKKIETTKKLQALETLNSFNLGGKSYKEIKSEAKI